MSKGKAGLPLQSLGSRGRPDSKNEGNGPNQQLTYQNWNSQNWNRHLLLNSQRFGLGDILRSAARCFQLWEV